MIKIRMSKKLLTAPSLVAKRVSAISIDSLQCFGVGASKSVLVCRSLYDLIFKKKNACKPLFKNWWGGPTQSRYALLWHLIV